MEMSKPLSLTVIARHSLVPLNSLLGAWLIGLIVSSVIFGVTCLQVYLYYTKYCSRDNVSLKLFVGFLLFLDTVHLALLSMSYYQASVTNFGDFVALATVPWSLVVQVLVGVFLSTLVQFFYAFRIWVLSNKSLWIPCLIGACATTELALASVYVNNTFRIESFSDVKTDIPYSTSALAFEVACDVLIAGSMTYNLVRNKTSFQKTSRAINTLIAYTINTGALTTLLAICSLVTWITSTLTLIYAPFFFILVRLYGCSFMSILNSRDYVREKMFFSDHAMVTIPSYIPNDSTLQPIASETSKVTTIPGNMFDGASKGGSCSDRV